VEFRRLLTESLEIIFKDVSLLHPPTPSPFLATPNHDQCSLIGVGALGHTSDRRLVSPHIDQSLPWSLASETPIGQTLPKPMHKAGLGGFETEVHVEPG